MASRTDRRFRRPAPIRIGCSGWEYRHWRGDFYPAGLPRASWLQYYAGRFDTVEINNSFYRLPEPATFVRWRDAVPRGFLFAVKASRYLTHLRKLKAPEDPLRRLFERVGRLEHALGPVLYQLPSRWKPNVERFEHFLAVLPRSVTHVVEFRDPAWYDPGILARLESHGVALCLHDMPGSSTGMWAVGPVVYVRFHGAEASCRDGYPAATLDAWAKWLTDQARSGRRVFVYFNNDAGGHAPRDAAALRARCGV